MELLKLFSHMQVNREYIPDGMKTWSGQLPVCGTNIGELLLIFTREVRRRSETPRPVPGELYNMLPTIPQAMGELLHELGITP